MNKMRKILSLLTVLTLFLLFSVSPVLAEEATGSTDGSTEAKQSSEAADAGAEAAQGSEAADTGADAVQTSETADTGAGTSEATSDTVQDTPEAAAESDNNVEEAIVPIDGGTVEETLVPIDGGTVEETLVPIDGGTVEETLVPIDGGTVEETLVPIDGGAETAEMVESAAENSVYTVSDDVLNVIVPINVNITIDPLELAGKGQIYSNVYKIKNDGDTDVLLTFTDIQVTFSDDLNFEALAQPFDEKIGSSLKAIYMQMDFGRSDIPSAVITDNQSTRGAITIPLASAQDETVVNSILQLNFSGSVNYAPVVAWEDNDVTIRITYTLEAVPPPPAEEAPLATDAAIETPAVEEATADTGEPELITEEITQQISEVATETEEVAQTPAEEVTQTPAEEATQTPAETAPATDATAPESPAESSDSADPPAASPAESPPGPSSSEPSAPSDTSPETSSEGAT